MPNQTMTDLTSEPDGFTYDMVKLVIQNINEAVFVVDGKKQIIFSSPVAEVLSGYRKEEALGKNYGDIFTLVLEKDNQIKDTIISDAIGHGEIRKMEVPTILIGRGGLSIPVSYIASPYKNKEGQIAGCVVVIREYRRERLIRKMANHDLKTPMIAIKFNTEMILSGDFGEINPQLKEPLGDIITASNQMFKMINDLLQLTE